MQHLIALIIPHAIAVALSPMPIAALILLLLSNKAKLNSIAFMLGWIIGLVLNVIILSFIFNQQQSVTHASNTMTAAIVNGVLGLFLLYFAFISWKSRPKVGVTPPMPKWMSVIETMSPWMSFVIALSLITINSKNTILNVAVGAEIGQLATSMSEAITAICVYTLIASITITVPVIAFLIAGNRLAHALQLTKEWFIYNSSTILFILFLILGVDFICKSFGG